MKFILYIFILIFVLYINNREKKKIILVNKMDLNKSIVSCLTYNIQRLPYTLRNYPFFLENINTDIICLQEYFKNIIKSRCDYLKQLNYNICIPNSKLPYKWDSGLIILSKFKIKFIDLIPFINSKSIDKLSEKGFLVVKIRDIYVINTHLQANYDNSKYYSDIIKSQLKQIENYIYRNLRDKTCLLLGDFNYNLKDIIWNKLSFKIITNNTNSNWDNEKYSTKYKKYDNQIGLNCDGGFLFGKKYKPLNIKNIDLDEYTDHLGVSFELV